MVAEKSAGSIASAELLLPAAVVAVVEALLLVDEAAVVEALVPVEEVAVVVGDPTEVGVVESLLQAATVSIATSTIASAHADKNLIAHPFPAASVCSRIGDWLGLYPGMGQI